MIVVPEFVHKSELGVVVCPKLEGNELFGMLEVLNREDWTRTLDEELYICHALQRCGFHEHQIIGDAIWYLHQALSLEAVVMRAYRIHARSALWETMIVRHAWCDHMREYLKENLNDRHS